MCEKLKKNVSLPKETIPAAKFTMQPNNYCAQLRETLPAAKGRKVGSRKFYNGIFVKFQIST
jgi:hypothetical protein